MAKDQLSFLKGVFDLLGATNVYKSQILFSRSHISIFIHSLEPFWPTIRTMGCSTFCSSQLQAQLVFSGRFAVHWVYSVRLKWGRRSWLEKNRETEPLIPCRQVLFSAISLCQARSCPMEELYRQGKVIKSNGIKSEMSQQTGVDGQGLSYSIKLHVCATTFTPANLPSFKNNLEGDC